MTNIVSGPIQPLRRAASPLPPPALGSASKEVGGALQRLRRFGNAGDDGLLREQYKLKPPALVACGRTGIEAHMLNEGVVLLHRVMRGNTHGLALVTELEVEILHQSKSIPQTQHTSLSQAQLRAVGEANERIRSIVARIRSSRHGSRHHDIRNFALDCIERSLRKKPWIRGTYHGARAHPIQDLELAPQQSWLRTRKRDTSDLIAAAGRSRTGPDASEPRLVHDLGVTEARYALQSILRQLPARGRSPAAGLRLDGLARPMNIRANWVRTDRWYQRLWDTSRRRQRSREGFIALLKAAGASQQTLLKLADKKDITPGDAKQAIADIFGPPGAGKLTGAYEQAGITDISAAIGDGGMGAVKRVARSSASGGQRHDALKLYDHSIHWSFPPDLAVALRRGAGADSAYAAGMRHVIAPLGYIVQEGASNDPSSRYRYVEQADLRPYLRQQSYLAALAKRKLSVDIVGDIQPLATGSDLIKAPLRDLDSNQMDALVTQGVSMLRELGSRGFVHGDIKPENLILDASGDVSLKLIDTDFMRKHGSGDHSQSGTAQTYTAMYSTPLIAYYLNQLAPGNRDGVSPVVAQAQDAFGLAISLLRFEGTQLRAKAIFGLNQVNDLFRSVQNGSNDPDEAQQNLVHATATLNQVIDQVCNAMLDLTDDTSETNKAASLRITFLREIAKNALHCGLPSSAPSSRNDAAIGARLDALLNDEDYARFRPPAL